ncbi:hypothetical protein G3578_20155 [Brevibacillus sp. SYP-B805]|nr:hypothetical protein [Brevibacillus sp. SYP-B805]NGQ97454.1 hypothetical protein [Brevibacillus sp. SYP-B805]
MAIDTLASWAMSLMVTEMVLHSLSAAIRKTGKRFPIQKITPGICFVNIL